MQKRITKPLYKFILEDHPSLLKFLSQKAKLDLEKQSMAEFRAAQKATHSKK